MNQNQEFMLMNVKFSDGFSRFGGMLDTGDYQIKRIFGVVTDEETESIFRDMEINIRNRMIPETAEGEYGILVPVRIDYDLIRPDVTAIINDREIILDEKTISCLDSAELDYANLTVVPVVLHSDWTDSDYKQLFLKSMTVYLRDPFHRMKLD